jgi:hypothetical protein
MTRSAYAQAVLDAILAGFYVPDAIDVYFRRDWNTPRLFAFELH